MLLKKKGYPEEDDLVMCTVTKVQFHSVFATLDEFDNKSGMIHISEVSPGRIRNIRDYVREGKKVICKVLRIHLEKGHIDLSLRRVTEAQRRLKVDEIKQEQLSEKIIEFVAKEVKKDAKQLYEKISEAVLKKHDSLYAFFQKIVSDSSVLKDAGLDTSIAKKLEDVVKSRIKEASVAIDGTLKLTSYAPDGVDIIKTALQQAEKKGGEHIVIKYKGAGMYSVHITAKDYKHAEKVLKDATEKAIAHVQKHEGTGQFVRQEA